MDRRSPLQIICIHRNGKQSQGGGNGSGDCSKGEEPRLIDETVNPSFLMVLCATGGAAYMRKDGVAVVPVDCLGP